MNRKHDFPEDEYDPSSIISNSVDQHWLDEFEKSRIAQEMCDLERRIEEEYPNERSRQI